MAMNAIATLSFMSKRAAGSAESSERWPRRATFSSGTRAECTSSAMASPRAHMSCSMPSREAKAQREAAPDLNRLTADLTAEPVDKCGRLRRLMEGDCSLGPQAGRWWRTLDDLQRTVDP